LWIKSIMQNQMHFYSLMGKGYLFNRQFSSLMSMTNFLIGIKSNSLEKMPNTIAYCESEIGLDNCPWH
jgi:hypothetical protein